MSKIYDNIVNRAKERNVSIREIERVCELAPGSVCKWNEVSPSVRSLRKVADFLECTLDLLTVEEAV